MVLLFLQIVEAKINYKNCISHIITPYFLVHKILPQNSYSRKNMPPEIKKNNSTPSNDGVTCSRSIER